MQNLNGSRLVLGGVTSGVIVFALLAITNTAILGAVWEDWLAIAKPVFPMPYQNISIGLWAGQSIIAGLVGTFIYAAIKDWIGAKLRASYVSGLLVWAVGWLGLSLDKLAIGVESEKTIYYNLLAALLGCLIGQFVASHIYKDRA
ncbi:hypothetical protein [Asticcacaulis sp. AC402]|uniref:hypothetical protein n=1 Tax=Asticcacaulis sp. AC402 TaxID=1282361 RepID=UPI0003C3D85B|nr:hypothetical protein [Asticcacaulis sp. AC402]ESQ73858.1 hypothetical protein ABAC402_17060 [Asticcacaulis sp. AC402]